MVSRWVQVPVEVLNFAASAKAHTSKTPSNVSAIKKLPGMAVLFISCCRAPQCVPDRARARLHRYMLDSVELF
eukprot:SAG22_NODE_1755_length_3653_cov_20.353967_2_plen_73_part_00